MSKSIFNPQLLDVTRQAILKNANAQKRSFVDAAAASGAGGDPAAAGGDPAAMSGDPAAMGGDPLAGAMPPGGDPAAAASGGTPPSDPRIDQLMQMMQQLMSQGGGGGAAGSVGGVEPIKPKIDVNVEIMQMKKLIAKICDAMKIPIPAADMVATPQDLTQMGMQNEAGGAAGAGPASAISPISPMPAAMPAPGGSSGEKSSHKRGSAVPRMETMRDVGHRAGAMAAVLRAQLAR